MLAAGILIVVVALVSIVAVLWMFVWAAREDGRDQQRRDRSRPRR